jgi:hypothetical protein
MTHKEKPEMKIINKLINTGRYLNTEDNHFDRDSRWQL